MPSGKVVEIVVDQSVIGYGLGVTGGETQAQSWYFLKPFDALRGSLPPNRAAQWRVTSNPEWQLGTTDAFKAKVRSVFRVGSNTFASGTARSMGAPPAPPSGNGGQADVGGVSVRSGELIAVENTTVTQAWNGTRAVYAERWDLFPGFEFGTSVTLGTRVNLASLPDGTERIGIDIEYTSAAP